jgi:hypothetical protein
MNSPDSSPKLPLWIFFLSDAVLTATAGFIAMNSPRPLSTGVVLTVFSCIFGGALIALVPLIARFERQKNKMLDERQRELEAMARTLHQSAEQISIATNGFHEIVELAQKNLRHAEQLPHKLQEKVAELQAQISAVSDAEREELEKELETLRASDSERLESIATKITKSTAEWAKLEAATQQHLTATQDAFAKLSLSTASAISKAQAAAEQALGHARTETARIFADSVVEATKSVEAARRAALEEIDARAAAAIESTRRARKSEAASRPPEPEPEATPPAPVEAPVAITPPPAPTPEPEPAPAPAAVEPAAVVEPPAPAVEAAAAPVETVPPLPAATAEPAATDAVTPEEPPPPAAVPKPPRKRAPKKVESEEPTLPIEDSAPAGETGTLEGFQPGLVERVLTSDGATRLLVTAYIGIGNRLFIRGDGPGLSWDKGVPLQFVSIGKWRWETNDATGPLQFKLYKNDEIECSALGNQRLDPGHQQEVTAAF